MYSNCHSACPSYCNVAAPDACIAVCVSGCECPSGLYRAGDKCYKKNDCPLPPGNSLKTNCCWITLNMCHVCLNRKNKFLFFAGSGSMDLPDSKMESEMESGIQYGICNPFSSLNSNISDCDPNARCVKPMGLDYYVCECKGRNYLRCQNISCKSEHYTSDIIFRLSHSFCIF